MHPFVFMGISKTFFKCSRSMNTSMIKLEIKHCPIGEMWTFYHIAGCYPNFYGMIYILYKQSSDEISSISLWHVKFVQTPKNESEAYWIPYLCRHVPNNVTPLIWKRFENGFQNGIFSFMSHMTKSVIWCLKNTLNFSWYTCILLGNPRNNFLLMHCFLSLLITK